MDAGVPALCPSLLAVILPADPTDGRINKTNRDPGLLQGPPAGPDTGGMAQSLWPLPCPHPLPSTMTLRTSVLTCVLSPACDWSLLGEEATPPALSVLLESVKLWEPLRALPVPQALLFILNSLFAQRLGPFCGCIGAVCVRACVCVRVCARVCVCACVRVRACLLCPPPPLKIYLLEELKRNCPRAACPDATGSGRSR